MALPNHVIPKMPLENKGEYNYSNFGNVFKTLKFFII